MLTHHSPDRGRAGLPPSRTSARLRAMERQSLPPAAASIDGRGDSDPMPQERLELATRTQEVTTTYSKSTSKSTTSFWDKPSGEKTSAPAKEKKGSSLWGSSDKDEDDLPSFGSVRFSNSGSVGVSLGNGTSLNSDGSVGFNVGGVSFNSNGTISWGL